MEALERMNYLPHLQEGSCASSFCMAIIFSAQPPPWCCSNTFQLNSARATDQSVFAFSFLRACSASCQSRR